ncbi:hypothetical protein ACFPL7_00430 [Dongia soli]|uniref:Quinol:cytochrome c oxidoreductase quinone-binding subunit 2 n=1 Tax=Dongia soli TaxID=600628 RepID=A0ABU5EEZ0_9PROT|nr:hypothetical protein [Dongia soli]MDY0884424.1 hypothetical protein [Dongia soli]
MPRHRKPIAEQWPRHFALAGICLCAAALLTMIFSKQDALAGWLVGLVFWSSLPIGALALVMMMRIIPGAWNDLLAVQGEVAVLLLPLAACAALPILAGLTALYPWSGADAASAFRAIYLTPLSFIGRTALFFLTSGAVAFLLLRMPRPAIFVAPVGLIALVLLDSLIAVDWVMSLDPAFHSSGFGLYILSIQMTMALACLIIARLMPGAEVERVGLLGALLLTALLLWAYFSFMQYFIIWSDNLSPNVAWYQRRGAGLWSLTEYAIGVLQLGPAFLLLFPITRQNRRWLVALSMIVLMGKALETAWLVLPDASGDARISIPAAILAITGLGFLSVAGWRVGSRRNEMRRQSTASDRQVPA